MFKAVLTAGVVACCAVSSSSAATVIFEDNFDTESLATNGSLSNWSITDGTIDVIGDPGFFDFYTGNGRYVDLDGSSRNAARIETSQIAFRAGQLYRLSFSYGRNTQNDNTVPSETMEFGFGLWSDVLNVGAGAIPAFLTITRTFSFAVDGTGSLFFDHEGGDNQGIIIDNVALSEVPLPAGSVLLIGGLAALAGLRRRKHA